MTLLRSSCDRETYCVISPHDGIADLCDFVRNDKMALEKQLHDQGLILFRGFNVGTAEDFRDIATAFTDDLMSDNGEHVPVPETDMIYTPVEFTAKKKLLWHNENSFNHTWPLIIMFCCLQPADSGGETPITDSRQVLQQLDAEVVEEFTRKGVMYVRTHGYGIGRSWQEVFHTTDRNEMEAMCDRNNVQVEWRGGDKLITRQIRPAVVKHPISGVPAWFSQAQHWHPYCLEPAVRTALEQIYAEDEMPRNCFFGDGSAIEDDLMKHILDVYEQVEISFPWQHDDILILDNVLFAHSRNPYTGKRKLLVTMGKHANFTANQNATFVTSASQH